MSELFVDLAIPVSVDTLFTYRVPPELREDVARGVRAIAPFGKRAVIGIVVNISRTPSTDRTLKSITDVIDSSPVLSEDLLKLTEWISRYYLAPWGEVMKAALVQGTTSAGKRTVRLLRRDAGPDGLTQKERTIVRELFLRDNPTIQQLQKRTSVKNIHASIAGLVRKKILLVEEETPGRALKPKTERVVEIGGDWKLRWEEFLTSHGEDQKYRRQASLLRELLASPDESIPLTGFLRRTRQSLSSLRTLEKKGLIACGTREVIRTPSIDHEFSEPEQGRITLNHYQQRAFETIREGIRGGSFTTYLLHGVTGSGKTQVYIEAIRAVLGMGRTAIVLVPEISLTPQTVYRFRRHFGGSVVSLHSRMSAGERYDAWRMIREKKYSVVIGPRSAVFAPLEKIGLIVVDEEHEGSFKQFDQSPRYHARDVAIMRASIEGAVVVLGSATPSIESYDNARNGKYALLELPERVDAARLPEIEIVDMTGERQRKLSSFREERKAEFKADYVKAKASTKKFEFSLISDLLNERITDRLRKKEGIILLQNRRGFAPVVECHACGYAVACENCSISLTYHRTKGHCRCHYCGFTAPPPRECPQCRSKEISLRGFGTQRVEDELRQIFPSAKLLRMDLDTTTSRGSHHRILQAFANGEADILLGTQMVAKGLDFSRVTLVGVISADTQMLLPDFRSAERTFQLLTQVAGRAGRSALAGEVVIQTFQPKHYAIQHVIGHDVRSFYAEELAFRKELLYPPFSRLVVCECRGEKETEVVAHAGVLGTLLKELNAGCRILGPAPAAIPKIKKRYRWHIVVKDPKSSDPGGKKLRAMLTTALSRYRAMPMAKKRGVEIVIDVDPAGML